MQLDLNNRFLWKLETYQEDKTEHRSKRISGESSKHYLNGLYKQKTNKFMKKRFSVFTAEFSRGGGTGKTG